MFSLLMSYPNVISSSTHCVCLFITGAAAAARGQTQAMRVLMERGADVWGLYCDQEAFNSDPSVRAMIEEMIRHCDQMGIFSDPYLTVIQWYKAYSFVRFCSFHLIKSVTTQPLEFHTPSSHISTEQVAHERVAFEIAFGKSMRGQTLLHNCSLDGDLIRRKRQIITTLAASVYEKMALQSVPMPLRSQYIADAIVLLYFPAHTISLISLRCVCRATSLGRFPVPRWQKELEEGLVEAFLGGEGCRFVSTSLLHQALKLQFKASASYDIPDL